MAQLPVLRWHEGMAVHTPDDDAPIYVDVGVGRRIDEHRWYWLLSAILAEHPEPERLTQAMAERPGLTVEAVRLDGEPLLAIVLNGGIIGYFDNRLLDANLTPVQVVNGL